MPQITLTGSPGPLPKLPGDRHMAQALASTAGEEA